MPRRSKRDRVYHHHLRRLCVSLVGGVMTSAARGARSPRMSNGEAFFLHGVGPNFGGARVRGRGAIPSRDALPPSVHLLSLPAIYTGGDGCDPAEEHEVVLSLPLASWRMGASVSCEIGGERLECRALRAGRERGRIVVSVAVRPPPGTEGVAFFEPAGVAPPRGYDSVIAAPVILCAERAVCAAVNRAFHSAEKLASLSSNDVPDRFAAYHRDDAIVALGAALVREPERRPVDPAAAAVLRRWACGLPSNSSIDEFAPAVHDSPSSDDAFDDRGSADSAGGSTTTNDDSHFHSRGSPRVPVDALAARILRNVPFATNLDAASVLVAAARTGRASTVKVALDACQRLVDASVTTSVTTRRRGGESPGGGPHSGVWRADHPGLAVIPVSNPRGGEPETALHVAATLDDAGVACALLADPIAAKPYTWSTCRLPGGGPGGGGAGPTPAEAAATMTRNRSPFDIGERHPSTRVEKVLADAAALVVKRLKHADALLGPNASIAELAAEARRRHLAFVDPHRDARGWGSSGESDVEDLNDESSAAAARSSRSRTSLGSSLGSIERDHERDAVVFAKLDDPNGVSHLVDTFVRGKRDPSVDAALAARLRQMRHEGRGGSARSGLRLRTATGVRDKDGALFASQNGRYNERYFWTMTKRWLACCVPDGETSSLAPDFWSPTSEGDRSRSFAKRFSKRHHHEHQSRNREDSDETAMRRRLGTLAASPVTDVALAILTVLAEVVAVLRANSWRPSGMLSHYGAAIADPVSGTAVLLSHLALLAVTMWGVIHVFVLGDRRGTWYRRRETFVCLFRIVNPMAMRLMVHSAATVARTPLFLCDPWWGARMHVTTMVGAEIFRVRYERLVVLEVAHAIVSGMYDHISPKSLCVGPTAAVERDLLTVFRVVGLIVPLVMWTYAREAQFRRFPKVWDKVVKKMV